MSRARTLYAPGRRACNHVQDGDIDVWLGPRTRLHLRGSTKESEMSAAIAGFGALIAVCVCLSVWPGKTRARKTEGWRNKENRPVSRRSVNNRRPKREY